MADDTTNGESEPHSVLGSLPATRPQRLRREVTVAKTQGRGPRPAKAKAPRARAGAPKPASRSTTKTTTTRSKTASKRASVSKPAPIRNKPVAVSAGCPPLERPRGAEPPPRPIDPPKGAELVTTAIQATGELARIGFTLGGRALKRAVDRLPRP